MKKNTLATAVVAGLAGVAGIANISTAVNINPDGVGQVLLYPYYTVNGNNSTLISVVNTTNTGKAVKVRFLEARNSREVLDFNLYLSEFDVWTAAIFSLAADGAANLTTTDTSCTVPGIQSGILILPTLPGSTQRFIPFRNTAYASSDAGPDGITRTREGHIEMIEMATVENNSDVDFAITHFQGTPNLCRGVEEAWIAAPGATPFAGIWTQNAAFNMLPPSGGLYGGAAIINVGDGTFFNYNADAIDGFSTTIQHTLPASTAPSLATVNESPATTVRSFVFNNGNLITSTWVRNTQGIDAISALFVREAILNEYSVEPGIAASTEWVVTFPTKAFYVDPLRNSAAPVAPFQRVFPLAIAGADGAGTSCDDVALTIYDREEGRFNPIDFSPSTGILQICFEANPLWFQRTPGTSAASASRIFGAPGASGVTPALWRGIPTFSIVAGIVQQTFNNGWGRLAFHDPAAIGANGLPTPIIRAMRASADGDVFNGLPASGFWAFNIENNNARPGVQGFYGGLYPHRGTRRCTNTTTGAC